MDNFFQFLASIIYTIPFLLAYLTGVVIALMNYRKMPKPAFLALVGCSLLLLNSLINIFRTAWFFYWFSPSGRDAQFLGTVTSIIGVFTTLFGVAGFIFLLAAIFVKRDYPPQT